MRQLPGHRDSLARQRMVEIRYDNFAALFLGSMSWFRPVWARVGSPAPSAIKACRENVSVLYTRMPRLFADLAIAHGDARYARLLRSLARVELLILDDWGPEALDPRTGARPARNRRGSLRQGLNVITVSSRGPWHQVIGIPTFADAILDRVIHNAYRIELAGESLRRTRDRQTKKA